MYMFVFACTVSVSINVQVLLDFDKSQGIRNLCMIKIGRRII